MCEPVSADILVTVSSGLLFGLAMAGLSMLRLKRITHVRPDGGDERVVYEDPANHFYGGEGTGGWLYLTSQRLFLKSHSVNLHPHETTVLLSGILEARLFKTARLFPNGLEVLKPLASQSASWLSDIVSGVKKSNARERRHK